MKDSTKKSLLERTAAVFELPADLLAGLPCVRIVGSEEVYVQNHRGILAYGEEEIIINGGKQLIRVVGQGLRLSGMTPADLTITGSVRAVELE